MSACSWAGALGQAVEFLDSFRRSSPSATVTSVRPTSHGPGEATVPSHPAGDDGVLVAAAVAGDAEAIEAVLARLACVVKFVFRLNRTMGYGLATEVLEDVVQQVYAAMWPRLRDYAGGGGGGGGGGVGEAAPVPGEPGRPGLGSLETWAFGFCRNCLRAEARKRANRLRILRPVEDPGVLDSREDAPEASPVHRAEQRERLDRVRDELAQLPELERVVVELRHLEDWSFERIARELGIAASTVKDRCYRGLSRIEERLRRRDVGA